MKANTGKEPKSYFTFKKTSVLRQEECFVDEIQRNVFFFKHLSAYWVVGTENAKVNIIKSLFDLYFTQKIKICLCYI